jgi:hypothetical protein
MGAFLLANWRSVLAVVATAALCYLLHTVDVNQIEEHHRVALAVQIKADGEQCDAEKKVTKDATDALANDRDDLARKLAALKLQRPASCVPISRSSAVLNQKGRPARRDEQGLSTDWLYDYSASQCSTYWRQLKVCDKFLDDERKVKP